MWDIIKNIFADISYLKDNENMTLAKAIAKESYKSANEKINNDIKKKQRTCTKRVHKKI